MYRKPIALCMTLALLLTGCQNGGSEQSSTPEQTTTTTTSISTTTATTTAATTTTTTTTEGYGISDITAEGVSDADRTALLRFCEDVMNTYAAHTKQASDTDFTVYGANAPLNRYLQYAAANDTAGMTTPAEFVVQQERCEDGYAVITGAATYKEGISEGTMGLFYVVVTVSDGECVLADLYHENIDTVDQLHRAEALQHPETIDASFWSDEANYSALLTQLGIAE